MAESSSQQEDYILPWWTCNLCSEEAMDPVCTTCGHLFCWPCLHRWVHDSGNPCPVCQAPIAEDANIIAVCGCSGAGSSVAGLPPRPLPVVRPPPPPQHPRQQIRIDATVESREQAEGSERSARQNAQILEHLNRAEMNRYRDRILLELIALSYPDRSGTQPPPPPRPPSTE